MIILGHFWTIIDNWRSHSFLRVQKRERWMENVCYFWHRFPRITKVKYTPQWKYTKYYNGSLKRLGIMGIQPRTNEILGRQVIIEWSQGSTYWWTTMEKATSVQASSPPRWKLWWNNWIEGIASHSSHKTLIALYVHTCWTNGNMRCANDWWTC